MYKRQRVLIFGAAGRQIGEAGGGFQLLRQLQPSRIAHHAIAGVIGRQRRRVGVLAFRLENIVACLPDDAVEAVSYTHLDVYKRQVYGRSVYSVGGNEEAARLSGIRVWRTRIATFALTGFLAAFSGIILSSRIMSGSSNIAQGLEFEVIAAVIIGGTSLMGGVGTIAGTFLGVLFIGLLGNGMVLMGINPFAQEVIRGLIILAAVLVSVIRKR